MWLFKKQTNTQKTLYILSLNCICVCNGGLVVGGSLLWLFRNRLFQHLHCVGSHSLPCLYVYNQIHWPLFLYTVSHPARSDLFLKYIMHSSVFRPHLKVLGEDVSVDVRYRILKTKSWENSFLKSLLEIACCHNMLHYHWESLLLMFPEKINVTDNTVFLCMTCFRCC